MCTCLYNGLGKLKRLHDNRTTHVITIDGSKGEGGGQVLRSALALSLVTGKPFRIQRIRAGRAKPGLMRQHLTALHAAAEVGRAQVRGAALGSADVSFAPTGLHGGEYHFAVGTAGSATLVLQTVLPALWFAPENSTLRLEGGTHNPWAPPFDFLQRVFLPLVNRMGPVVEARLVRPGFYPAGGGEIAVRVRPALGNDARGGRFVAPASGENPLPTRASPSAPHAAEGEERSAALKPIKLLERGAVKRVSATATVAHLPRQIAERELHVVAEKLGLADDALVVEEVQDSLGPGNVIAISVECEHLTEVFTGFGERRVTAEAVAEKVTQEARRYLSKGVPVGEYLTDQLLIPMAMAGGGAFRSIGLSRHAQTNIDIIQLFLDVHFDVQRDAGPGCIVRVEARR